MRSLVFMMILLACAARVVATGAPTTISYQGALADAGGNPVADSNYSITFTIYDAGTGGNEKWSETQDVNVESGRFAVLLGSVNPILDTVFSGAARYLGIAISGDPELTPRTELASAPYAQRVSTVDGASGGKLSGKLSIGPGNSYAGDYAFVAGANNSAGGEYSTVSGGHFNAASTNSATVSGGSYNVAGGSFSSVGGGSNDTANGWGSTVSGGQYNRASDAYATVGGGLDNVASGLGSTIGGGNSNSASGVFSTVGGGDKNHAAGYYSYTVGYADSISATGDYSVLFGINSSLDADSTFMVDMPHVRIGNETTGFELPTTDGSPGQVMATDGSGQLIWSTVTGNCGWLESGDVLFTAGQWGLSLMGNTLYGQHDSTHVNLGVQSVTGLSGENYKYITIGGGFGDTASGNYSTIAGGVRNRATGDYSAVGGGFENYALGSRAYVGGGYQNMSQGSYGTVAGGHRNIANDPYATVGGGSYCVATADYSTVAGGYYNLASGIHSAVSGGANNTVSGQYSAIGGGRQSSVAADYSFAMGYRDSIAATGDFSMLFGINSQLTQDSTFMVDMPHIRLGDETNGYELPNTDGSAGQALATDGAGSVGWATLDAGLTLPFTDTVDAVGDMFSLRNDNANGHGISIVSADEAGYFRSYDGAFALGALVTSEVGEAVVGHASNAGAASNIGGRFSALGETGIGVIGLASNTATATNYGGFFEASGTDSSVAYGPGHNVGGIGVYGEGSAAGVAAMNSVTGDSALLGTPSAAAVFSGNVVMVDDIGLGSTSKLLMYNDSSEIGVKLDASTGSNFSIQLPDSAIDNEEILDEPGIAAYPQFGTLTLNPTATTMVDVVSVIITVPAAGYVLVHAEAGLDLWWENVSWANGWNYVLYQIDDEEGGSIEAWVGQAAIYEQALRHSISHTRVFHHTGPTTATYRLEAMPIPAESDEAARQTFYASYITAVYLPTSYGPVVSGVSEPGDHPDAEAYSIGIPGTEEEMAGHLIDLRYYELKAKEARLRALAADREALQAELELKRLQGLRDH